MTPESRGLLQESRCSEHGYTHGKASQNDDEERDSGDDRKRVRRMLDKDESEDQRKCGRDRGSQDIGKARCKRARHRRREAPSSTIEAATFAMTSSRKGPDAT